MIISELVKTLNKFKDAHGDIIVCTWNDDYAAFEEIVGLELVNVSKIKDGNPTTYASDLGGDKALNILTC